MPEPAPVTTATFPRYESMANSVRLADSVSHLRAPPEPNQCVSGTTRVMTVENTR